MYTSSGDRKNFNIPRDVDRQIMRTALFYLLMSTLYSAQSILYVQRLQQIETELLLTRQTLQSSQPSSECEGTASVNRE